jgi:uncharacterized membrane protein
MTRFLEIKKLSKLDESIKRKKKEKDPPQNKPRQKKSQKIQNLFSLSLLTFVVLLSIDAGVVVVTIRLFCSKKWLLSYVPLC